MATARRPDGPKKRQCPMCGQPAESAYRPFCSKRCKELDLGNWLNESYRVPVVETDDMDPDGEDDQFEG
ncbi:MAG: DNA gyrase inhibitor YacG [Rhodospirillales bacterium]|nr:DNA gyrase inhibitor YacG [Rhodospirillaceae bacterium]MDP6429508.1 DNA gyrase inhibitor YacG [Rhodospirillales bacterium]MDP6645551.1 DNA gyrase inhibitor YacG [Rhodospirillales bacterium]MDP6840876.1 DNA gyrase inhibitor YacG [Rhodospirillales bacterium]